MYAYMYTFIFIFFSIMGYHRILNTFPVLYNRTFLFIHSIYNSLHLLTPNSRSIPPPLPLPIGNHRAVLSVW